MAWIKRNKLFVISMGVGLILTGYCVFLFAKNMSDESAKELEYQTSLSQYKSLQASPIYPSDKNIALATEEQGQVKALLTDFQKAFVPFPTPPKLDEQGFKAYLNDAITQLRNAAASADVTLPDNFSYAFSAQQQLLTYPPENIQPWMDQLGEMRAICSILYAAKVNSLVSVQRVRVSPTDDGPQSDYFDAGIVTNAPLVATPYKVCFRGFSRELASVLEGLARSSNCFIVKAVQVQHDMDDFAQPAPIPGAAPVAAPTPLPGRRGFPDNSAGNARPAAPVLKAEPVTILSEKMFRVSLSIDVVKLSGGVK